MNQKNKLNWPLLGAVAGICAAPFTGGASLWLAVPSSAGLGLVGGSLIRATGLFDKNNDDSNLNANLETWKLQHEQWQKLVDANRLETERLRKEREENNKLIKKTMMK